MQPTSSPENSTGTGTSPGASTKRGIQHVKKRLADGTVKIYAYDRANRRSHAPKYCDEDRYRATLKGEFARRAVIRARQSASQRKLPFSLTPGDVVLVLERQTYRCALTGVQFDLRRFTRTARAPLSPSLDRIDSSGGYVAGNIRVVCLAVNIALGDWGETVFLNLAAAAVARAAERALTTGFSHVDL